MKFPTSATCRWLEKLEALPIKNRNQRKTIRYYRNLFRATPEWLTAEHKTYMRLFAAYAHERGLEVDHIVPLKSDLVCGLHVPWNLQAICRQDHNKKGNLWWPDSPFEQSRLNF